MNAKIRHASIVRKEAVCPICGLIGKRHSIKSRRLVEVGHLRPTALVVAHSVHFCETCNKYFNAPLDHIAPARSRYTHRVRWAALDLVNMKKMSLEAASRVMRQKYFVHVPPTTLHDWLAEQLSV